MYLLQISCSELDMIKNLPWFAFIFLNDLEKFLGFYTNSYLLYLLEIPYPRL